MNQKIIKTLLVKYDNSNLPLDDKEIDILLGIDFKEAEKNIDPHDLTRDFGIEQYRYEGTPYDFIRYFLNKLSLNKTDIVYDLGSGYGRVIIYGALTREAYFKGIEIVPSRTQRIMDVKNKFQIDNLDCQECNILDTDYSDGNIFFLFNPFFYETLQKVGSRLEEIAKRKKIKIITWGGTSNDYFTEQSWLSEKIFRDQTPYKLQFFESRE